MISVSSDFTFVFIDTAPPSACKARFGVPWQQCLRQKVLIVVFFITFSTHKQEHKRQSEVSLHNTAQLFSSLTIIYFKLARFTSQHSSTDSHTIVYFKLAQLSRRKGHNDADSQAHSQAVSQACRCLGWQKHGVNEIGEASPSSSGAKQKQFLPCNKLFSFIPP